jgi:hypothetical protein
VPPKTVHAAGAAEIVALSKIVHAAGAVDMSNLPRASTRIYRVRNVGSTAGELPRSRVGSKIGEP